MRLLKDKEVAALREVVAMGQTALLNAKPSRAERKAAKWSYRVLQENVFNERHSRA